MEEMKQYSYKLEFWRFTDCVTSLDQLGCCDDVYVEKVSIKERFRKDEDGFRMKYYQMSFTVRTRLDLEQTYLMKHIKDRVIKDLY